MSLMLLGALPTATELLRCPTLWGLAAGAAGLLLLLPAQTRLGRPVGILLVAIAGGLIASDLPLLGAWTDQGIFWVLSAITIGAAVATIASRSPVYSAVWFALSLLGTAGLFLYQGAQFLGAATVVVYAGAIVVTFLFVIMLAQPEGHAAYDRLTWGGLPKFLAVVMAAGFVAVLTFMIGELKEEASKRQPELVAASGTPSLTLLPERVAPGGVLDKKHVANLGRHLFSQHLISVEVAGTMLLVALVGAVAIAIQGRAAATASGRLAGGPLGERIEEALR